MAAAATTCLSWRHGGKFCKKSSHVKSGSDIHRQSASSSSDNSFASAWKGLDGSNSQISNPKRSRDSAQATCLHYAQAPCALSLLRLGFLVSYGVPKFRKSRYLVSKMYSLYTYLKFDSDTGFVTAGRLDRAPLKNAKCSVVRGSQEDAWKAPMFQNQREVVLGPQQGRSKPWF
jgi:hypothetical protein